jgi:hypothetical protein
MESFDIESLLQFSPPTLLRQKCHGLHREMPVNRAQDKRTCQVCGMEYLATDDFSIWRAREYFRIWGLTLDFKEVISHCRTLATIAHNMRNYSTNNTYIHPPMRSLLESLQAAEKFIHFVTFGMSRELLGAIRAAAIRVPVFGIISNADKWLEDDLKEYSTESPNLQCRTFPRSERCEEWSAAPHQKIIIVDGLLAFKGSANLTVDGWRKAAKGLDSIEVVTDVQEVMDLNNRLFSPVWASFSNEKQAIMSDVPF